MAPELLTKGEVSAKCDVYSYAIILWEMLTSEHPFRGYDVLQVWILKRTHGGCKLYYPEFMP
jgi:serine/threonine protein kinase